MKIKTPGQIASILLVGVLASSASASAQSTRDRGASIIFTPPKSDTVSTNLEKLNQKESPFKGMESSIRKPFDVFNMDSPRQKMTIPRQGAAEQRMNQPSVKSILEKTAEEEFLKGENRTADDPYDPFKSPDYLVDPYKKKPKTALDRYYDRLENENTTRTNGNSMNDFLGDSQNQKDGFQKIFGSDNPKDFYQGNQSPAAPWSNQSTNNNRSGTDGLLSRSARQDLNFKSQNVRPNDPFERETRQRETRLENFKRLLDGNVSTSPQQFNAGTPPPAPAAYSSPSSPNYNFSTTPAARPGYLSPATTFSPPRPSGGAEPLSPSSSFTKSSGIVGTPSRPASIQSFGVSAGNSISTPIAPPAQPKRAPATYNPPTRR